LSPAHKYYDTPDNLLFLLQTGADAEQTPPGRSTRHFFDLVQGFSSERIREKRFIEMSPSKKGI
jgi:hypothetical protein